jgi:hypothetical protein
VGEAPVTPVSTLDSSFQTFPTNRAITRLILINSVVKQGAGKGQKKGGKKEYVFCARPEKWKQKNISF